MDAEKISGQERISLIVGMRVLAFGNAILFHIAWQTQ
jgi:hypothetical protein